MADTDLADTYFLGRPLPIAGRLYVLTEKQQELQLVCIDPARRQGGRPPRPWPPPRTRCSRT